MNIEKLKKYLEINNVISNYRKVCEQLDEKVLTGNAKISQLKELERYFCFNKQGNKFVFTEVYSEPKDKVDGRKNTKGNNNIYGKYIEQLVLDLLVQKYQNTQERKIYLSRDKMLRSLDMVNDNYTFGKFNRIVLSDYLDISNDNVKEFYMLNNKNLYDTIERAFASLSNKCLVSWKLVTTVACGFTEFCQKIIIDNEEMDILDLITDKKEREELFKETHTTATDEQLDKILYAENRILEEMGLESKRDAFLFDKYTEFNNKVCELLNKTTNIKYYYKSYDIIFHEKVVQELEKISQWILEQEERQNIKVTLNGIISNNIITNAEERHNKAIEEKSKILGKLNVSDYKHINIERRSKDNYIEDNKNIVNTVINNKVINITSKMIKVHKNKNDKSNEEINDLIDSL